MSRISQRRTLILALLLLGLIALYAPRFWDAGQVADPKAAGFLYVTDLDFWQRTEREQAVTAAMPLDLGADLNQIPLRLGEWQGEDVPLTNIEVFILLEPEQTIQRLYRDQTGHYIWLSLMGGRTSRTFHPPDICYDADGWRTRMASHVIPLPDGGELHGLWLEAEKSQLDRQDAHRVFYFYLFPDRNRDQADGIVLVKLTSPPYGTTEETLAIHEDFLAQLFTRAQPVEVAAW